MNENKLSLHEQLVAIDKILEEAECVPESEIRTIMAEFDAIALDLGEVVIGVDLDFQRARLEKNTQRLREVRRHGVGEPDASTQIHGGGTGKE